MEALVSIVKLVVRKSGFSESLMLGKENTEIKREVNTLQCAHMCVWYVPITHMCLHALG